MSEVKRYKYHKCWDGYNFISDGKAPTTDCNDKEIVLASDHEQALADARRAALLELEQAVGCIFARKQGKQYCDGFADARNEIQQLISQRASEGV